MADTDIEEKPSGLDSILDAAIEEHYVEDTPPAREPSPQADLPLDDGRPRDERGRFAPGQRPSQDPSQSQSAADAQPDPAAQPIEPPRNYTAEQKARFSTLPREAQQWVTATEREREAEYTRRSQEVAEFKRNIEPLLQAVGPFHGYLSQIAPATGQAPAQMLNSLLAVEYRLRTSEPLQKADGIVEIMQSYGIPPELLIARLTGQQIPQQYLTAQPQPQQVRQQIHPIVQQQEQRLRALEYERQQAYSQAQANYLQQQIDQFVGAKDAQGNLLHPHFDAVRDKMAIYALDQNDEQKSDYEVLEASYAAAMQSVKSLTNGQQQTNGNGRQAAVEKARRAAPVRSSAATSGAVRPRGLDAVIANAMDQTGMA